MMPATNTNGTAAMIQLWSASQLLNELNYRSYKLGERERNI